MRNRSAICTFTPTSFFSTAVVALTNESFVFDRVGNAVLRQFQGANGVFRREWGNASDSSSHFLVVFGDDHYGIVATTCDGNSNSVVQNDVCRLDHLHTLKFTYQLRSQAAWRQTLDSNDKLDRVSLTYLGKSVTGKVLDARSVSIHKTVSIVQFPNFVGALVSSTRKSAPKL